MPAVLSWGDALIDSYDKLQSWKNGWDSLSDMVQKVSPLSPMQCWSESCCQRPHQVAQHWMMGVGKDMTNGEIGGFFKTMHCPKCPYNREHWDNCNKVDQVSQLFFSRIVDNSTQRWSVEMNSTLTMVFLYTEKNKWMLNNFVFLPLFNTAAWHVALVLLVSALTRYTWWYSFNKLSVIHSEMWV